MLTAARILDAFDAIGMEAARRGLVAEIAVDGGSWTAGSSRRSRWRRRRPGR